MRLAIVTDRTKSFFRTKQTIRSAKSLNDVLVIDDFVQIERVNPFRVEARKHLIDNNEQIDSLVAFCVDCGIGCFVGKSGRNVFLHVRPGGNRILLAIRRVIIANYLNQSVLFYSCTTVVVYARVEQRSDFQLRSTHLNTPIIANRLRD